MTVSNYPVKNLVSVPVYGLEVSKASATTLSIAAGRCRDSSNKMDISVGADFETLQGSTVSAPLTLDSAVVGANGLDAGTLAADKVYAVYVIGDSRGYNLPAGLISLASNSSPTMPFGYDAMRLVGYAVTATGPAFLDMYQFGKGHSRELVLDVPQATSVTAGNSTTFADVDLSAFVPPVASTPVKLTTSLTPASAGNALNLKPYNAGATHVQDLGQVSAVVLNGSHEVLAELNSSAPSIEYSVTNASDAAAIKVAGFKFEV